MAAHSRYLMVQKNNKLKSVVKSVSGHIRRHRILYIIFAGILIIYLIIRIFFTPPLLSDTHFGRAYTSRDGELLRITLTPDDKYRLYTPLAEISPDIQRATILYEDKYFKYHPGVNPIALIRAAIDYISGTIHPAGASTITMQVARLKYDMDTRQICGKLKQIAAAIYIDLFYSKDEILEAYLNLAPYGGNIESIGAASLIYFNKPASELSKIESITLSTIPQNPVKRGLNTDYGLANMSKMRSDLVRRWIAENPTDTQLATFAQMPLAARTTRELPFYAPHFVNHESGHHKNYWNEIGPHDWETKTTLDLGLQQVLERALANEIDRRRNVGITNAAAILVNYKTMETLAYIGSVDYFDKNIYGENDGVHARRSPGSTLKPLIYTTAVDMGLIHSMTLLKDAKINFGVYAPENADSEFYGPVLARDALTHSRNIPAINLLRQIGTKNFYKILAESGVSNLKSPDYYGISVALGGAEVSMFELADIYATMANLGLRHKIRTDTDSPLDAGHQILSPEAFFITLDMLARQQAPTKQIPFAKNATNTLRHYWKTGTSSSFRDAWTAGIFGDFVLIVWVGNFDGTPNNAFSGANAAAPIYFSLAAATQKYYAARGTPITNNNFLRDDLNISEIEMCDGVGGLAGKYCPKTVRAYFIPGKSPIDTASVYRAVPIDIKTGLRACSRNPSTTKMVVYEFWDSEYLDMFERAGIHRNTPPPFIPGCDLGAIAALRRAPIILSPIDNTRTVITDNADATEITFHAISDAPDAKIFWFLDNDMIGTTISGEKITRRVSIGEHSVRIIDDMGAGTRINFSVIK